MKFASFLEKRKFSAQNGHSPTKESHKLLLDLLNSEEIEKINVFVENVVFSELVESDPGFRAALQPHQVFHSLEELGKISKSDKEIVIFLDTLDTPRETQITESLKTTCYIVADHSDRSQPFPGRVLLSAQYSAPFGYFYSPDFKIFALEHKPFGSLKRLVKDGKNFVSNRSTGKNKNSKILINSSGSENLVILEEGSAYQNLRIKISGSRNFVMIGKNSKVNGDLHISASDCQIIIGNDCEFTSAHSVLAVQENITKIVVGNGCLIGRCTIRTSDSHSILDMVSGQRINPGQNVFLNDRVWVAQDVKILKGVSIASDTVIGADSLVTKSLDQANSVYAGNPAKLVRTGVRWCRERI